MKGLTRSQLAKASNVSIETIRYYERRGLISEPPRNDVGYRMFPQKIVQDIEFIKRAQDLGFKLEEIKNLLAASNGDKEFHSDEIYDFATSKIQEVEEKIRNLNQMKALLEDLAEKCPGSGVPKHQCPIMKKISEGVN
ncbi:MerR family transcriptional regulator [Staphylococcus epidermidis]|nr:MerR family transcriptional regulator [Staphylococcus epidermidis]MCG1144442.1 MerR family transcriptional regulator [Staphylococcus epidermidis]MCG1146687.1 MerR family transcriptional regulator [Staphylococcus epidermidis]MCG1885277.1 MerR family transcriptional regulator [Staphylococcus epidermidis]MCG2458917.1 MerR family transcriptional regulator [Staphylococcus epidermidis]